jgi:hypothetical protein
VQSVRPSVTDVLRSTVLLFLAMGLAACGVTSSVPPVVPTASLVTSAVSASPSAGSATGEATPSPSASATPGGPSSPPPSPTSSADIVPTPTPAGPDAAAAACSGSSQTKDFFTAIAEAVDWPVYCAVLPAGWSVDRGAGNTYALANGGRMVIGYHTLAGLHLELREGHWCTDSASACSPHDADIGPLSVGTLSGELMSLGGSSGFAVYVAPGESPSWTVTGAGMDEAAFRQLVGALAFVSA